MGKAAPENSPKSISPAINNCSPSQKYEHERAKVRKGSMVANPFYWSHDFTEEIVANNFSLGKTDLGKFHISGSGVTNIPTVSEQYEENEEHACRAAQDTQGMGRELPDFYGRW